MSASSTHPEPLSSEFLIIIFFTHTVDKCLIKTVLLLIKGVLLGLDGSHCRDVSSQRGKWSQTSVVPPKLNVETSYKWEVWFTKRGRHLQFGIEDHSKIHGRFSQKRFLKQTSFGKRIFLKYSKYKKKSFIPIWTSMERRLIPISWEKIIRSAPSYPPRYNVVRMKLSCRGIVLFQKPLVLLITLQFIGDEVEVEAGCPVAQYRVGRGKERGASGTTRMFAAALIPTWVLGSLVSNWNAVLFRTIAGKIAIFT